MKVFGTLTTDEPVEGDEINGVLLVKDFKYTILNEQHLSTYTPDLIEATFQQCQIVPTRAPLSVIKWLCECMFGTIKEDSDGFLILDLIRLKYDSKGLVRVEWDGNHLSDMIADSIVGIIIEAESSPASVKGTIIILFDTLSLNSNQK